MAEFREGYPRQIRQNPHTFAALLSRWFYQPSQTLDMFVVSFLKGCLSWILAMPAIVFGSRSLDWLDNSRKHTIWEESYKSLMKRRDVLELGRENRGMSEASTNAWTHICNYHLLRLPSLKRTEHLHSKSGGRRPILSFEAGCCTMKGWTKDFFMWIV